MDVGGLDGAEAAGDEGEDAAAGVVRSGIALAGGEVDQVDDVAVDGADDGEAAGAAAEGAEVNTGGVVVLVVEINVEGAAAVAGVAEEPVGGVDVAGVLVEGGLGAAAGGDVYFVGDDGLAVKAEPRPRGSRTRNFKLLPVR